MALGVQGGPLTSPGAAPGTGEVSGMHRLGMLSVTCPGLPRSTSPRHCRSPEEATEASPKLPRPRAFLSVPESAVRLPGSWEA